MHNKSVQTSVQQTPNRKESISKEDTMNINAIKLNNVNIPNGTEQQIPFGKSKVQNSTTKTPTGEGNIEFKNNFEGGKVPPVKAKGIKKIIEKIKDFINLDQSTINYLNDPERLLYLVA